jgi:hypothetical protein
LDAALEDRKEQLIAKGAKRYQDLHITHDKVENK